MFGLLEDAVLDIAKDIRMALESELLYCEVDT